MRYVIDTSALMQAYIQETYTDNAKALLSLLASEEPPELNFLEIGLAESTNVLWKHVRLSNLTPELAHRVLDNLRTLPLHLHTIHPYLDNALTIGLEHELAIYDSLYIALAQDLQLPLITADRKQTNTATALGVTLKPLVDFKPSGS